MTAKSIRPEHLLTEPIGGAHHCIGSGHAIVDLAFRYLYASCVSHGGSLTKSNLTAAHADILDGFSSSLDYFELIHRRCMDASGVTASTIFTQGKILPAVLSMCSQRMAAHCFSLQFGRLGADWLKLFFDVFSNYILKHAPTAETRLASAYAKAGGDLRQKLSIATFLSEQEVQDVLRDCVSPFEKVDACNAMASQLTDEVNHWIGKQTGSVCPHVSKITTDQMRMFLTLFPREVSIHLNSSTAAKLGNQRTLNSSAVTANYSSI